MLVSEAITLLKTTDVKQIKVGEDDTTIIGYMNLGILELHKRFALMELEATITQKTAVDTYTLSSTDANVTIDLSDNELLMIERVYDEDDHMYIIDNEKDPDSLSTPKFNQIKVATIVPDYVMSVTYRATPKFLTATTDTIPLQLQFIEALFMYVGYKAHSSIKVGVKDENNTYYVRFEAACKRIKAEGLFSANDLISTKFEQRGFV